MKIVQVMPFEFAEEQFISLNCNDGRFYLPILELCETMGLDVVDQIKRIRADEGLCDALSQVNVSFTDDFDNEVVTLTECIWIGRLDYLMGSINVNKLNKAVKARVILFKQEFASVVWRMFYNCEDTCTVQEIDDELENFFS